MNTENKQIEAVKDVQVDQKGHTSAQNIEFLSEVPKDTKVEFEASEVSDESVKLKVKVSNLSGGKLGPFKVTINVPKHEGHENHNQYCSLPQIYCLENNFNYPEIEQEDSNKEAVFQANSFSTKLWLKGATLYYYFLETPGEKDLNDQKKHVIAAFQTWKDTGLNLNFVQTNIQQKAQIVIGFNMDPSSGSWSYIGTDNLQVLSQNPGAKTMNFGWLNIDKDGTALHEIGHALGFSHEQQSPACEIIWDEVALIKENPHWDIKKIKNNIIDKLKPSAAKFSGWDRTSIMQYPVKGSTVLAPPDVKKYGIQRNTKLSATDIQWIRKMYPK